MISVDGPPEEWAASVAALLVARDVELARLQHFFSEVYAAAGRSPT